MWKFLHLVYLFHSSLLGVELVLIISYKKLKKKFFGVFEATWNIISLQRHIQYTFYNNN